MTPVLETSHRVVPQAPALLLEDDTSKIAFVPSIHCLELQLPHLPRNDAELLSMLADSAPLMPADLVWTTPAIDDAGIVQIVVARRRWLAPFVAELERERGHKLEVRAETSGLRFLYNSPSRFRQMTITRAFWGFAFVAVLIALAIVLRREDEAASAPRFSYSNVAAIDPVFARPNIAATLAELSLGSMPELRFAAISGSRDGALMVELATPDPDTMRAQSAGPAMLPNFREVTQARGAEGMYTVTYLREGRDIAIPRGTVAPLQAADAIDAALQVERALHTRAAERVVQITLAPPTAPDDQTLEFDAVFAGPQNDVLLAANHIENGRFPMRFAEWSLVPDPAGVRLSATLIVPWTISP